jgi:hypothetical protein
VIGSPTGTAKRQSVALQLSNRSFGHITHSGFSYDPYKIRISERLLANSSIDIVTFCRPLMDILDADAGLLHRLILSDEAQFQPSKYAKKQNCRYWSDEQPHTVLEMPLRISKVTVWCRVLVFGTTGPHFFEEGHCAVTVNSTRHRAVLEKLEVDAECMYGGLWVQQDGPQRTQHVSQWAV